MNISIIPLNTKGRVDFDFVTNLSNYKSEDIVKCDNIKVAGYILDNGTDDYEVNMQINGIIYLKSAVNLSIVPLEIHIDYNEFVNNLVEKYKNSANTLDILPIVWENILLEIPIRAENAQDELELTSGQGWEVISEKY